MAEKILIIIPAFNEENVISDVIGQIKKEVNPADILIVDDGSLDKTAQKAKEAGANVVSLPFNLGYGSALEVGYKYAHSKGYDYLVQLDADGQHEPRSIKDLLKAVREGGADLVIGSRFLNNCGYKAVFTRRLGMIIFSKITSFLTGKKITDSTSGFQAINRKVMEFFVNGFYPSDYPDADVLIILDRAGFKIVEMPVTMYSNNNSHSMHRGILKPMYYIFKMFLSIFMIYVRKKPNT